MAIDIARSSKDWKRVLEGGDWSEKSKAYLAYLAAVRGQIEAAAAAEAMAQDDSDVEDKDADQDQPRYEPPLS